MTALGEHEILRMYFALALMLFFGRLFGELARLLDQAMVIGELMGGLVLGRTILGAAWPSAWNYLFEPGADHTFAVFGIASLSVTLFMLVAGLDMNLPQIRRNGREAGLISLFALVLPFFSGFVPGILWPDFFGKPELIDTPVFAVFLGTSLSITALPIVVKVLRDLGLIRTKMGAIVLATATVCDLVGWCLFAITLSLATKGSADRLGRNIGLSVGLVIGMLTVGRALVHKMLPPLQAHFSFPGAVLAAIGSLALFAASLFTYLELHATLGSFLVGIAFGDSPHFRDMTRATLSEFIDFVFAPLFFASVFLDLDLIGDFEAGPVFVVLLLSLVSKLVGGYVGARLAGLSHTESMAVAASVNTRGGISIILADAALQNGLIGSKLFVAQIIMAIVTSMMAGPLLRLILPKSTRPPFTNFIPPNGFIPRLNTRGRADTLRLLCETAGHPEAFDLLMAQKSKDPALFADRVAVPCTLMLGLARPVVVVSIAHNGVALAPPSISEPVLIVVLVLSPTRFGEDAMVQLVYDIRGVLASEETRQSMIDCATLTEVRAVVQIATSAHPPRSLSSASLEDSPSAQPQSSVQLV